jgi:hypothetical protein
MRYWVSCKRHTGRQRHTSQTGIHHPDCDRTSNRQSPDALVGDEGLVEIKCPRSTTHLDYLTSGKPPAKYVPQMLAQLSCTRRKWVDFVSFDNRFPEHLQLFVVRFEPKQEEIEKFETKVKEFLAEVNNLMEQLCPSHTK